MAQTLKFGNKVWAAKEESVLAYNDINNNYKPLPFFFKRTSIGTRVNKDGLIETMGQDIARIDYTDSADGVLLLEPTSTNLATYSQEFSDSSWNKVNSAGSSLPIVTSNYGVSPDGTQNADRIQVSRASGAADFSSIYKSITISSSNRALSVWLKSLSGTPTILITNNNGTYVSQQITTEWVRYELDLGVGTLTELQLSVVGSNFVQGVSESADFLAWGYQLEALSYATSYIPTSGSTVTRAEETCNNSGNSEVFNDSEGVLFGNISALANDLTTREISISDGSLSNTIAFMYNDPSNNFRFLVRASGTTYVDINIILTDTTISNKVAFKYKENDFSAFINGFEVGSDNTGLVPTGNVLNELSLTRSSGRAFYGNTKEIGYYDTALTDAELEYQTSYRNWVSMVNELNLNIIYNG